MNLEQEIEKFIEIEEIYNEVKDRYESSKKEIMSKMIDKNMSKHIYNIEGECGKVENQIMFTVVNNVRYNFDSIKEITDLQDELKELKSYHLEAFKERDISVPWPLQLQFEPYITVKKNV